jgi:hypothetical protein
MIKMHTKKESEHTSPRFHSGKQYHIDKFTFGKTQSAINLMGILEKEHKECLPRVMRLLSRQSESFNAIMHIPHEHTRNFTLDMWHKRFPMLVAELPEVVRTHTLCVETGWYRQLLRDSKKMPQGSYYKGFPDYLKKNKDKDK